VQGFAAALGVALTPAELSPGEQADAARLYEEKYATEAWTRRPGVAER